MNHAVSNRHQLNYLFISLQPQRYISTMLSLSEGNALVTDRIAAVIRDALTLMSQWWNACFILTHWGRVTHICVSKLTIISSDNGLSPDRRQAIIWTNAGILLIGPLGTNFSEILIEILTFPFKKMRLKVSSAKRWPFCLGLNVINHPGHV